jgi:hypothetical protein
MYNIKHTSPSFREKNLNADNDFLGAAFGSQVLADALEDRSLFGSFKTQ